MNEGKIERGRRLEDNSYLSEIDRQTLSEDISYRAEILERHPTVFLRPDDRTSAKRALYIHADEQGVSYLGLITKYGNHETRTPPEHEEPRIEMRIKSREAKPIGEISPEEFEHMYHEIHDAQSAIAWLKRKYPKRRFSENSKVTVYRIEYV